MTVACQMLLKNFILSFYKMLVRTQEIIQVEYNCPSIEVQAYTCITCIRWLKWDGVWENVCSLATSIDKLVSNFHYNETSPLS